MLGAEPHGDSTVMAAQSVPRFDARASVGPTGSSLLDAKRGAGARARAPALEWVLAARIVAGHEIPAADLLPLLPLRPCDRGAICNSVVVSGVDGVASSPSRRAVECGTGNSLYSRRCRVRLSTSSSNASRDCDKWQRFRSVRNSSGVIFSYGYGSGKTPSEARPSVAGARIAPTSGL